MLRFVGPLPNVTESSWKKCSSVVVPPLSDQFSVVLKSQALPLAPVQVSDLFAPTTFKVMAFATASPKCSVNVWRVPVGTLRMGAVPVSDVEVSSV